MGNYIKHGTGPNDWKKGNRKTKEDGRIFHGGGPNPAATEALKEISKEKHEETERYKEIAEATKTRNRYGQEYALELLNRLSEYIDNQRAIKKPITIGGLVRASGMNVDSFQRYRHGNGDYLLYQYMDKHGIDYDEEGTLYTFPDGSTVLLVRLSDVIKNALLTVQEQLEGNCYTNKGNPAGSIFGLKASFGWQDQPQEQRTTNNNTLVLNNVATLEEAREALKLLTE